MTAAALLAALEQAGCFPRVEGKELVLDCDPPAHLDSLIVILQSGLRALLTSRPWNGVDPETGHFVGPHPRRADGLLAFGALDPTALLPPRAGLLSTAGDPDWDRVSPFARLDHPELFAPDVEPRSKTR